MTNCTSILSIAEMMEESGIWISPTLQSWTRYPRIVELKAKLKDRNISISEEAELQDLERRAEKRLDVMRRMLDYDLRDRIVPGTDSGVNNLAFGHLDYDLQLLAQVGFTPAETLIAATRISAEAIGLNNEIGTIQPGKVANLAAFDGDPTVDVDAFSCVVAVFQAGCQIK